MLSIVGTGAAQSDTDFTTAPRTTTFRVLAAGESPRAALAAFRSSTPTYRDHILVLAAPPAIEPVGVTGTTGPAPADGDDDDGGRFHHVVGWWLAERLEDWANAEMYFVAVIDDVEDKSEETIDVSADRAPDLTGPSMPWTPTSALRRLHGLLRTGVFDWGVSADEAREALALLDALRPDTLMTVITFLQLDDCWM